jgi:hypothetical protein
MPRKSGKKPAGSSGPAQEELTAVALLGLGEVTGEATFESTPTFTQGEGVISAHFAATMEGYPGWFWTVELADIPDHAPTVLEVELVPGETALLSPAWVPWADRMEEYLHQEKELKDAAAGEEGESDEDDAEDDLDVDGDVDGVDIDQLDLGLDPVPWEESDQPGELFDDSKVDEADSLRL